MVAAVDVPLRRSSCRGDRRRSQFAVSVAQPRCAASSCIFCNLDDRSRLSRLAPCGMKHRRGIRRRKRWSTATDAASAVAHRVLTETFFMAKSSLRTRGVCPLVRKTGDRGRLFRITPRFAKCKVRNDRACRGAVRGLQHTVPLAASHRKPAVFFRLTAPGTLPMFRRNFGGAFAASRERVAQPVEQLTFNQ